MTVSVVDGRSGPYYPNGVTVDFGFDFKILATSEIEVVLIDDNGIEETLAPASYSVAIAIDGEGGTVTTDIPLQNDGRSLWVVSNPSFEQQILFEDEGPFNSAVLNPLADRAALRDMWLRDRVNRAIKLPANVADGAYDGKYPVILPGGGVGWSAGTGNDPALRADLFSAIGDLLIKTSDGVDLRRTLLNRVSVRSLLAADGYGLAYFDGSSWVSNETDDDALENLINEFRNNYARFFANNGLQTEDFKQAMSLFVLQLQRRFWYISRDMPEIPAGVPIDAEGSVIVIGAPNIRVLRTQAGAQGLLQPGGTVLFGYGADYLHWKLPTIIANGHPGTFVHLNTVAHSRFSGLVVKGATGSSYTISGAAVNGSRFIGLSPADFAKLKWGDVITDGAPDPAGNPRVFQAKDTRVINPAATGRTYGYIKLSEPWTGASGNINFTQCSFPVVMTGVQQSEWNHNYYTECDWKVFWGSGPDEVVSGRGVGRGYGLDADWQSEAFTNLNPCTDMRIYYDKSEKCKYAVFVERGCSMMNFIYPSYQFNSIGSEFIARGINCRVDNGRVENRKASLVAADDKEIPSFVAIDCRLDFTGHLDWVPNDEGGTARYLLGVYGQSNVRVESWGTNSNQTAPLMPDGSRSPFLKPSFDGTLWVGTCRGITGPNGSLNYVDDPLKWATNGANAPVFVNYRGDSGQSSGTHVRFGPAMRFWFTGEGADGWRQPGDNHSRVEIRTDGGVWFGPGNAAPDCSIRRIGGAMVYDAAASQHVFNMPTHADEAAALAAGLTTGVFYMTPTGEVRRKL